MPEPNVNPGVGGRGPEQDLSGFKFDKWKKVFSDFGIDEKHGFGKNTENNPKDLALKLVPNLTNSLKEALGRDPKQYEIAAAFNGIDPNGVVGNYNAVLSQRYGANANSRGPANNPSFWRDVFRGDTVNFLGDVNNILKFSNESGINDAVSNAVAQQSQEFDTIASQYSPIGIEFPDDIRKKFLLSDKSIEEKGKDVLSYVVGQKEGLVKSELEALPERQSQAISDLDRQLQESQGRFFQEQLSPSIMQQLNARGLLDSGSLAASLAETGGRLSQSREQYIAPLRAETALGAGRMNFENTLRGALESGQSLSQATSFARNLFSQQQQNQFASGQNALNRQFQDEQSRQNQAFQLASQPRQKEPSALDYFLGYGLPVLGQLGSGALSGYFGKK